MLTGVAILLITASQGPARSLPIVMQFNPGVPLRTGVPPRAELILNPVAPQTGLPLTTVRAHRSNEAVLLTAVQAAARAEVVVATHVRAAHRAEAAAPTAVPAPAEAARQAVAVVHTVVVHQAAPADLP